MAKKSTKKTTKATKPVAKKGSPKAKKPKQKRHHLKHHPLLTFMRVVRNGLKNLWRNAWLSFAATTIMAVTLTTILLSVMANKALNDTIDEFAQDLKLSVYLLDDSTNAQQVGLLEDLQNNPLVSDVEFISKDDALKDFKTNFKDEEELINAFEIVDENILPASFEITVADLGRINELVTFVEADQYAEVVENTSDDNETAQLAIDRYTEQQRLIIMTGVVVAAIFAAISMMVIFNTIRLAIYSRAEEVRTMKLLGASHGYIRGPFLFEATMYGVISGLISVGVVLLILKTLIPELTDNSFTSEGILDTLNRFAIPFFDENILLILGATVGGGIIIGFVSSALALSRYMKY